MVFQENVCTFVSSYNFCNFPEMLKTEDQFFYFLVLSYF
jgi:hypothetical protein